VEEATDPRRPLAMTLIAVDRSTWKRIPWERRAPRCTVATFMTNSNNNTEVLCRHRGLWDPRVQEKLMRTMSEELPPRHHRGEIAVEAAVRMKRKKPSLEHVARTVQNKNAIASSSSSAPCNRTSIGQLIKYKSRTSIERKRDRQGNAYSLIHYYLSMHSR